MSVEGSQTGYPLEPPLDGCVAARLPFQPGNSQHREL
jgi:hypothetical protein